MDRRSPFASLWGTAAALLLGLTAVTLILVLGSPDPLAAVVSWYWSPLANPVFLGNLLGQTALLTLTGLGTAVAFSAGAFNLGGEGQTYLGALAAIVLGLALPPALGAFGLVLILLAGLLAGASLGAASGLLKTKTGADDLITTFLLSAAVLPIVDAAISSAWLRPEASQLLTTRSLDPAFWFPQLLAASKLSWGALVCLPLAAGLFLYLYRTSWGFRLRMTGSAPRFAETSGYSLQRFTVWPLFASGGFMGLAGALAVTGTYHAALQGFTWGLGWNGISAALIARNNPLAVLPAALFLAWMDEAGRAATLLGQFPYELGPLAQGLILLLITAQTLVAHRRPKPEAAL